MPTQFIERLSLLDRGELRGLPILFVWLTTSWEFQRELVSATTRNARMLLASDFELLGPDLSEWADIVEETFAFHNQEQPLADFEVLRGYIEAISYSSPTLGATIERVGARLGGWVSQLQDLSQYQVVMLWPVTDGLRISRVSAFASARDGYKLDWGAFYRSLNEDDRRSLPLAEMNRARPSMCGWCRSPPPTCTRSARTSTTRSSSRASPTWTASRSLTSSRSSTRSGTPPRSRR